MLKFNHFAIFVSVITFIFGVPSMARADPLRVVASFSVIADFAANVGGGRVEISTLVGPDGDAHVYEPKPADAVAMSKADIVLVNGLHFEGFLKRLIDASATKANIVELTKDVTPIAFKTEFAHENEDQAHDDADAEHDHNSTDPHAFQSVPNAKIYVRNIEDAFCIADAEGCNEYKANAAAYIEKLDALDVDIRQTIEAMPAQKRTVITSHDAFGYFEHEYGVNFRAPQGFSTASEPSAADVARLIEQVRHEKAAAIFIENITNPRLIEQIASETDVKIGGTLYSDALSPADGPASTYIDMMRNNITQISDAIMGM